jgi:polyisoprenoid-binding protein YceI
MSTTATLPFTGTFAADQAHSTFQFEIRHMGVSMFRATFDDVDVRVVADDNRAELEGTVRTESISIKDPPEFREHVVYGADFFDAHNHPEISFRSLDVNFGDDGTLTGRGELTVKGITKAVSAVGTYQAPVEDPYGAQRAALELTATVDRRDWGMDWQAPLPKGGDVLGYDVSLTVQTELIQQR